MIQRKYRFIIIICIFLGFCINIDESEPDTPIATFESELLQNSLSNNSIDYLIITIDDFKDALEPLAIWKSQKGLFFKIETISNINHTFAGRNLPERIKNCITSYHQNNNTQWILLAGDHQHIPSQYIRIYDNYSRDGDYISCDSYYSDLDHNWDLNDDGLWGTYQDEFDFEAEVFVGRLTANNEYELEILVQKIINYEKSPLIGEWMTDALYASSILAFNQDWNYDNMVDYNETDGNRFNNFLQQYLPDNWSSTIIALNTGLKSSDYSYDLSLNYENFKNVINDGCNFVSVSTHGGITRMMYEEWTIDNDKDMLFDYTNDPIFENGTAIDESEWKYLVDTYNFILESQNDKLGVYFLDSCNTGTFDYSFLSTSGWVYEDCLAEYFLKNVAISCIASSYVTWAEDQWYEREHGGWFSGGLAFRFWEQIFQHTQSGRALAFAKADYINDRNNSTEPNDYPEWEDKVLKQYNLFGDPEVNIWTKIPKKLTMYELINSEPSTTFQVIADGNLIENCTVTLTKDDVIYWKGYTSNKGLIEIPFSKDKLNILIITASKINYVPYQIGIPDNNNSNSIPSYNTLIFIVTLISFVSISIIINLYCKKLNNE
ncbi:MAG: hypothetical protein HWN81_17070 [Candidatus Lokiarchaeota archaeon]|nr:hypothetical protein [Candidatus Lokiarchaeota archaeon]